MQPNWTHRMSMELSHDSQRAPPGRPRDLVSRAPTCNTHELKPKPSIHPNPPKKKNTTLQRIAPGQLHRTGLRPNWTVGPGCRERRRPLTAGSRGTAAVLAPHWRRTAAQVRWSLGISLKMLSSFNSPLNHSCGHGAQAGLVQRIGGTVERR